MKELSNQTRKFLFALCMGVVAALIYNEVAPKEKYYYNKEEVTKEFYEGGAPYNWEFQKIQAFNLPAVLSGAAVTIALVLIGPLNRKKATGPMYEQK